MVSKPHHGFGIKIFMPPPVRLIKLRLHIPCEMIEVLLPQCSFVSLRCPDDSETRHLSNERTLSETHLMIKTARAALRWTCQYWFRPYPWSGSDANENEPQIFNRWKRVTACALRTHDSAPTWWKGVEKFQGLFFDKNIGSQIYWNQQS